MGNSLPQPYTQEYLVLITSNNPKDESKFTYVNNVCLTVKIKTNDPKFNWLRNTCDRRNMLMGYNPTVEDIQSLNINPLWTFDSSHSMRVIIKNSEIGIDDFLHTSIDHYCEILCKDVCVGGPVLTEKSASCEKGL
jgi:hypothetical protein